MKLNVISFAEMQDAFFENSEAWLSTKDVAKFLCISENAVRIMVCRGVLPCYKLKNRLRFRKIDCAALVQKTGA